MKKLLQPETVDQLRKLSPESRARVIEAASKLLAKKLAKEKKCP